MSNYWSPIVDKLVPYKPGEQPKDRVFIKLNTNENPYGPSPHALDAIRAAANDDLRLYPDPAAIDLRQAIADTHDLAIDNIFVGNGSDEILAHAFNAFFNRHTPVLFADITYSFYPTYCQLYGLQFREVPLNANFEYEPADFQGPCAGIVLTNPNAPTGAKLNIECIEQVLSNNPDIVVLVDEAYVDFGAKSAVDLVPHYENLVITQSFSKSRSLAGLRLGFAIAQPHLIEALFRVKDSFNSYPIGRLTLQAAVASWKDRAWFEETRNRVIADRERTAGVLRQHGFRVLPSAANFLFVSHDQVTAEDLSNKLRASGILVRHFNRPRIDNWLRISIGTSAECDALLSETNKILNI
ncbi:MAG: histidinol-phosphate transaminase [Pseudomonadota bacterium]|nr:histidinol-phosphate transaminase [Pseudomonadota bacterium]